MSTIQGPGNKESISNIQQTDLQSVKSHAQQEIKKTSFGFTFTKLPSLSDIKNFFVRLFSLAKPPIAEPLNAKRLSLQNHSDTPVITKTESQREKVLSEKAEIPSNDEDLASVAEWLTSDETDVKNEDDLSSVAEWLVSDDTGFETDLSVTDRGLSSDDEMPLSDKTSLEMEKVELKKLQNEGIDKFKYDAAELLAKELNFNKDIHSIHEYRASLSKANPKDLFLKEYVAKSAEALKAADQFTSELKAIVESKLSPEDKMGQLGKLYSSETFKNYAEGLGEMTVLLRLETKITGWQEKYNNPLQSGLFTGIWMQRATRHTMSLDDMRKDLAKMISGIENPANGDHLEAGANYVSEMAKMTNAKMYENDNAIAFKSAFINASKAKGFDKEKILKQGFEEIDRTIAKIKMMEIKMTDKPTAQEKADFKVALQSLNDKIMEIRHSKDPVIVDGLKEHKKFMDAQFSDAVRVLSTMAILYS